jgi:hypothetical protein
VAIVVTNSQLFVIRRRRITGRVKGIDATYARANLEVDWTFDAYSSGGSTPTVCGRLRVFGSFGSREFWAVGHKRQALTGATARKLAE